MLVNIPAQRKRRLAECDSRAQRQHGEDKQENNVPGEKIHREATKRDIPQKVNSGSVTGSGFNGVHCVAKPC